MRNFAAAILATTFFVTNAVAATPASLAPGKPAGVHKAQMEGNTALIIGGLALAGLGVALAVSAGNAAGPTTSTTATVSSTP